MRLNDLNAATDLLQNGRGSDDYDCVTINCTKVCVCVCLCAWVWSNLKFRKWWMKGRRSEMIEDTTTDKSSANKKWTKNHHVAVTSDASNVCLGQEEGKASCCNRISKNNWIFEQIARNAIRTVLDKANLSNHLWIVDRIRLVVRCKKGWMQKSVI